MLRARTTGAHRTRMSHCESRSGVYSSGSLVQQSWKGQLQGMRGSRAGEGGSHGSGSRAQRCTAPCRPLSRLHTHLGSIICPLCIRALSSCRFN